jgi:lysophospholipase L1-like esterase
MWTSTTTRAWCVPLSDLQSDIKRVTGYTGAIVHDTENLKPSMIILRAHSHDIRIYGATIMPFGGSSYSTPQAERARQTVNRWIRTSGRFDAVIDFDAVTRDPKNPSQLSAQADSGDHLHPADAGYKIMADSINLQLFAK